jgi:hypothetical protein
MAAGARDVPLTGLLCTQTGLQPQGRLLLAAADVLAG